MKVIAFLFATLALVGAFAPAQQSRQSTKLYKAFWDNVSFVIVLNCVLPIRSLGIEAQSEPTDTFQILFLLL